MSESGLPNSPSGVIPEREHNAMASAMSPLRTPSQRGRALPRGEYDGLRETQQFRAAVASGDLAHLRTLADSARRPSIRAKACYALHDRDGLARIAGTRGRGSDLALSLLRRLIGPYRFPVAEQENAR